MKEMVRGQTMCGHKTKSKLHFLPIADIVGVIDLDTGSSRWRKICKKRENNWSWRRREGDLFIKLEKITLLCGISQCVFPCCILQQTILINGVLKDKNPSMQHTLKHTCMHSLSPKEFRCAAHCVLHTNTRCRMQTQLIAYHQFIKGGEETTWWTQDRK